MMVQKNFYVVTHYTNIDLGVAEFCVVEKSIFSHLNHFIQNKFLNPFKYK